jgi:hypothetical protein
MGQPEYSTASLASWLPCKAAAACGEESDCEDDAVSQLPAPAPAVFPPSITPIDTTPQQLRFCPFLTAASDPTDDEAPVSGSEESAGGAADYLPLTLELPQTFATAGRAVQQVIHLAATNLVYCMHVGLQPYSMHAIMVTCLTRAVRCQYLKEYLLLLLLQDTVRVVYQTRLEELLYGMTYVAPATDDTDGAAEE